MQQYTRGCCGNPSEKMAVLQELVAYHERHKPQALVVDRNGDVLCETYAGGFDRTKPHALYSGTKSFWGPAALAAQREGLLELDEPAAKTLESWQDDPIKRKITLRQLLNLTAGYGFGGLGSAVPTFDRAIEMPLRNPPGTVFTYGGIPIQVFGAVLARILKPGMSPQEYLYDRILRDAGVEIANWRKLADRTSPLPTGAFLTAHNWLRYGRYVLQRLRELAPCFEGSAVNPRYGLGWWLTPAGLETEVFYASGSGGQALYVVPSLQTVAVRFGAGGSFKHEPFLKRLLAALDKLGGVLRQAQDDIPTSSP